MASTTRPREHAGCPEQRRVGDPERRGGEDHGQSQSDRVDAKVGQRSLLRLGRDRDLSGCAIVAVRRSWTNSHQIDDREQPDPDDVERVPEQGKAEQAALHAGAKSLDCDLRHHHGQPDQSGGDVQPVAADQGEECGQKGAALRGRRRGRSCWRTRGSRERGTRHRART